LDELGLGHQLFAVARPVRKAAGQLESAPLAQEVELTLGQLVS